MTNTSSEVMANLDELSTHYSESVADTLRDYARAVRKNTLPLIKLMKPYKVRNAAGHMFIANNDREWRLFYDDLDLLVSGSEEYVKWANTP